MTREEPPRPGGRQKGPYPEEPPPPGGRQEGPDPSEPPPEPRAPASLDEELIAAERPAVASTQTDDERVARAAHELHAGFEALGRIGPAVTVFGSARTERGTAEYELARAVGGRLGAAGFAVITGGGPGSMEAANRGAREAGARSVGVNIELPHAQAVNPYLDLSLELHYFFARKVMFMRYASAFVAVPGGYGTLDELFESLTLMQTDRNPDFPVVLVGRRYWSGLLDWMALRLLGEGKVDRRDLELVTVTDDPDEVARVALAGAELQGRRPA